MIEPGQIRRFHQDFRIFMDLEEWHIIEAGELVIIDKMWLEANQPHHNTLWDTLHWGKKLLIAEDILRDFSDSLE